MDTIYPTIGVKHEAFITADRAHECKPPEFPEIFLAERAICLSRVDGLVENWTLWGILGTAIAAAVGGFGGAWGRRLATRQAFSQILEETKKTQTMISGIAQEMAQRKFIGETELAYRERQLAELYCPIYGSIISTGQLWDLWMGKRLGPLSVEVQELFRRQNDTIVEILKSKSHLVEGSTIPPSFSQFMTSVTIFNIGTRIGKGFTPEEQGKLDEAKYPSEFFKYIIDTTELLKANLNRLYEANRYSVPKDLREDIQKRRAQKEQRADLPHH